MKNFLYISSVKFETYNRYIKKKKKVLEKKKAKGDSTLPTSCSAFISNPKMKEQCGSTKHMFNDSAVNASITILAYSAIALLEFHGNNLTNWNQKQSRK